MKKVTSLFYFFNVCICCVCLWAGIPGDLDNNGFVDLLDVGILSKQWLVPSDLPSDDIAPLPNSDGKIDFLDFAEMAAHWLSDSAALGDINKDGSVNSLDLGLLAAQWLGPPSQSADIAPPPNGDGTVNFLDFAELSAYWLATLPDENEMVFLTGGQFDMGDVFTEGEADERPVHTVTIGSSYIGKHEITNAQYCTFLNAAIADNLISVEPDSGTVVDSKTKIPYYLNFG